MVCYFVETILAAQMLDADRYLVYIHQESIHSRTGGEFSFLDQVNGVLDWFGVGEDDDRMLRFSEDGIFRFHRNSETHRFNLAAGPFPAVIT